jgi:hypothetical protein
MKCALPSHLKEKLGSTENPICTFFEMQIGLELIYCCRSNQQQWEYEYTATHINSKGCHNRGKKFHIAGISPIRATMNPNPSMPY